jgi:hypothetical protein
MSEEERIAELDLAEQEVLQLMTIAAETAEELQRLPACNHERLNELSSTFLRLTYSVKHRIKNQVEYLEGNPVNEEAATKSKRILALQNALNDIANSAEG